MKLRVLFLKRKYIIYYLIFISVLCFTFYTKFKKNTDTVFSTITDNKTIKADLTGDGMEDILYVKSENNKYYIQINVENQSFYLEPDRKLSSIGYFYDFWPMKVTLMDLNRDKIQEIILQSGQKNSPIQHIFMWTGNEFKDIFCSTNNIIGFVDSQNNRTPKFISANINATKTISNYYMLIGNSLQSIEYDKAIPGKNTVTKFISYVESLPEGEAYLPKDIFFNTMAGKDLSLIGKLSSENKIYKFIDGIFLDTKYSKQGEAIEVNWTLNFKGTTKDSTKQSKLYTILIKLKNDDCNDSECYKIYSITSK